MNQQPRNKVTLVEPKMLERVKSGRVIDKEEFKNIAYMFSFPIPEDIIKSAKEIGQDLPSLHQCETCIWFKLERYTGAILSE